MGFTPSLLRGGSSRSLLSACSSAMAGMACVSALMWSAAPAELACSSSCPGCLSDPRRRLAGRSAATELDAAGVLGVKCTPHVLLLYCLGASCPCAQHSQDGRSGEPRQCAYSNFSEGHPCRLSRQLGSSRQEEQTRADDRVTYGLRVALLINKMSRECRGGLAAEHDSCKVTLLHCWPLSVGKSHNS